MAVRGITHVLLLVRDVPAATAFYREKLGVPVRYCDDQYAELDLPEGPTLALHASADAAETGLGSLGGARLTLRVDDVDSAHRRLLAEGVVIATPPVDTTWGREMIIQDLDGYPIYLLGPRQDGRPATR